MSDRFSDSDAEREALSALADGEAPSEDIARACAAWREAPEARATWHAYQMIGDVMRSEDLARASPGDAFLKNFRSRLAQEPVVFAPGAANANASLRPANDTANVAANGMAPLAAPVLRRRAWAGPMAVAAGFVAVVGALLSSQIIPAGGPASGPDASIARMDGGGLAVPDLAQALAPDALGGNATVADAGHVVGTTAGNSFNRPGQVVLVRDPQLDQALALHRPIGQAPDGSFAGQGVTTRQVVFDGR